MSLKKKSFYLCIFVVVVVVIVDDSFTVVERRKVSSQTKAHAFNEYKMATRNQPPQKRVVFDTLFLIMIHFESFM